MEQSGFREFIDKTFVQHPRLAGESYTRHLLFALKTGLILLYAGLIAILHGLIPRFHQTTASQIIIALAEKIKEHRQHTDKNI